MQTFRTWTDLPDSAKAASCALGNFDGVHLGHASVLDLARGDAPLGVITFEPHPREYFTPDAAPFRLMNAQARAHRLEKLGVQRLYQLPFDDRLAAMSPDVFARDVLHRGLGVNHVVIGTDFRFGTDRSGTAADLARLGQALGFGVTQAPLLAQAGREISSTAIRTALGEGRPRDAAAMLGHWHRIEGPVLHGDKRGRTLGFPTANIGLDGLHLPRFGVYAVRVDVLTGSLAGTYDGAASLGLRPMYQGQVPNLETFLLDFDGDLYNQHLSVALVDYLRPEAVFPSLDAFLAQMHADVAQARAILTGPAP